MASDARKRLSPILAAFLLLGCRGDGGVTLAPRVPLAYTRFVHAVADTGATDWRFVDQIENSPVAFGLAFRGFTPYQATAPGSRHLRVFPTSTDINVTSRFLIDTALTLAPDTYYTIVHLGYADASRAPKQQIVVLTDVMPTPDAASIGVRAVHLGTGLGAVDLFASSAGGTTPLPAAPFISGEAFGVASAYTLMPAGPLAIRVAVQGQRSPILVDAAAPAGVAGDPSLNLTTIGGSRMPGSVISAFFVPRSVAGTSAPQTPAFAAPALVYLIDRHPR